MSGYAVETPYGKPDVGLLTLVEMVTMRATPLSRARATTASSSSAKSGKSKWQWLSISMRLI